MRPRSGPSELSLRARQRPVLDHLNRAEVMKRPERHPRSPPSPSGSRSGSLTVEVFADLSLARNRRRAGLDERYNEGNRLS